MYRTPTDPRHLGPFALDWILVTTSSAGIVREWSRGAEVAFGRSRSEAIGRDLAALLGLPRPELAEALLRARQGEGGSARLTARGADGSRLAVGVRIEPLRDGDARVTGFAFLIGIGGEPSEEARLGLLLLAVLEVSPAGVALFDRQGRLMLANGSYCRLHGCETLDELRGCPPEGAPVVLPVEGAARRKEALDELDRHGSWQGSLEASRGGEPVHLEVGVTRLGSGGHVTVLRDVTRARREHRELQEREALYRFLAENATEVVALHDAAGRYTYVGPAAARLLGYDDGALLGAEPWAFAHPEDAEELRECFATAARGLPSATVFRFRRRSGSYVWLETRAHPIRDRTSPPGSAGDWTRIQSTSLDITERKWLEGELAFRAHHDPLTRLPNRSLFMERLERAMARAARSGQRVAVLFLDLDGFKAVNDAHGHAAGDELLVQVAGRLSERVREVDTLARLGGDEFVVLMEEVATDPEVEALRARLAGAFRRPFHLSRADVEVSVGCSIGATVGDPTSERPRELLRNADLQMYRIKRQRKGRRGRE